MGGKAKSEPRGVPRTCSEGHGADFTPRHRHHLIPAKGKGISVLQVAVSYRMYPAR